MDSNGPRETAARAAADAASMQERETEETAARAIGDEAPPKMADAALPMVRDALAFFSAFSDAPAPADESETAPLECVSAALAWARDESDTVAGDLARYGCAEEREGAKAQARECERAHALMDSLQRLLDRAASAAGLLGDFHGDDAARAASRPHGDPKAIARMRERMEEAYALRREIRTFIYGKEGA